MTHLELLTAPSQEQIEALIAFADEVSRLDGVTVPEGLGAFGPNRDAFALQATEGNRIVAMATVMPMAEPEIGLAVHPDRRRTGIGTRVLDAVSARLIDRGFAEALVVCEGGSESGKAFLDRIGAAHDFSEFRLERGAATPGGFALPDGMTARPAGRDDREVLIPVMAAAFGDSRADVEGTIDAGLRETERHFAIAELKGEPIGIVRIGDWEGIGDITALGIAPDYRGQGYGRALLLWAVTELSAAGFERIALEVETENANALGLYRSAGFEVTNEFAYYRLALAR